MDLIYADNEFRDRGVLLDYTLDMAFGIDENDFEIKMPLHTPECEAGWYIYIEGTEYGGIIDSIGADTHEDLLIYRGRTWNGILASKVIEPDAGAGYYDPQGEANSVVAEIIERCDLEDVFEVSEDDSGIFIDRIDDSEFGFRYTDANTGIFTMLYNNDGKLIMRVHDGKVHLSVVSLMNYGTDEFDSSQMKFSLVQVFAHCNHLVCLGQGELEKRYVIHLFTDEGGTLLPYATVDTPIKDTDYILDKSSQDETLVGVKEYADVYDYRDAGFTENYEMLTEKPDDWDAHYDRYYERSGDPEEEEETEDESEDDNYTQLERNIQDVYTLLDSKPSDWDGNAENYYTETIDPETGEAVYHSVDVPISSYEVATVLRKNWKKTYFQYYYRDGNEYKKIGKVPKYTRLSKKPKDWKTKWNNYYVTDGVNWSTVSGETRTKYREQKRKPSLWATEWKDAYIKRKVGGAVRYIQLEDDDVYGRMTSAPKWQKNTFYNPVTYSVAPPFKSNVAYYSRKMVIPKYSRYDPKYKAVRTVPAFAQNTYYRLDENIDVGVQFESGSYFRQWIDHYAELVAGGIDRLKELNDIDELTLDFVKRNVADRITGEVEFEENDDRVYDIGDVIAGNEEVTGVHTAQPITKKIVNIKNNVMTIQHEVR